MWTFHPDCPAAARERFRTLDKVFKLTGKAITRDRLSHLIHITIGDAGYYVKRYSRAGKGLRRWVGRSRLRSEWENLQRFERWNLPAARVMAFGIEKRGPFFKRGAVITAEISDTTDLAQLVKQNDPRLKDAAWINTISRQVAHAARTMHHNHFAHGDMRWRNILVRDTNTPRIYLIDCPGGKRWVPPFLQYRKNKDIACLDKYGKTVLRRTQRLRFYLDYLGRDRLTAKDKRNLRHILRFFQGRD